MIKLDMSMIKFNDLTLNTQEFFKYIYDEIQGSRTRRYDAGFVTGWFEKLNGDMWYRNTDALPSFSEWMAQSEVIVEGE